MATVRFMKTFVCNVHVWVDGVKTEETAPRVKAMFVREVSAFNGLATSRQYGSLFLNADVTEADAADYFDTETDYESALRFEPIEGEDFYRVTIK